MLIMFWIIGLVFTCCFYSKIIKWQTLSRLGFLSEAPEMYVQKAQLYHYLTYALFVFCLISAFFISFWLAPLVIVGWIIAEINGRSKGVRIYRIILKELRDSSQDKREMEKIEKELNKTDSEILKSVFAKAVRA